jgi:hypothetical protein
MMTLAFILFVIGFVVMSLESHGVAVAFFGTAFLLIAHG